MSTSQQSPRRYRTQCAVVGLAFFFSAIIYYVIFRQPLWSAPLSSLADNTGGAYPSFAFCLSAGLLCIALLGSSRKHSFVSIFGVLAITLLLEVLMGTFSWLDVCAALLGTSIAMSAIKTRNASDYSQMPTASALPKNRTLNNRTLLIWLASFWLVTGSYYGPDCAIYEGNECVEFKTFRTPVYMNYVDLRSSVRMGPIRELRAVSRIYLYKSLILINERNEGIHIIDNRLPANPKQIGFIEIPGNTEISVKDDYLYADSYIDLVTLSLADTDNITEVAREQDIFPYDAFQNIPYNVDFDFGVVDRSIGVVVGYK